MEILVVPAVLLICLLYLIYQSIHDKKSPVITLLCIALFVGLTALAAFFSRGSPDQLPRPSGMDRGKSFFPRQVCR